MSNILLHLLSKDSQSCLRNSGPADNENGKNRFHLRTIAIEEMRPQHRTGRSCKYRKDKWGFIAKEQVKAISGWKITKTRHQE